MEDYEINILRRDGNWKKVRPNDLIIDEINEDLVEDNELDQKKYKMIFFLTLPRLSTLFQDQNLQKMKKMY